MNSQIDIFVNIFEFGVIFGHTVNINNYRQRTGFMSIEYVHIVHCSKMHLCISLSLFCDHISVGGIVQIKININISKLCNFPSLLWPRTPDSDGSVDGGRHLSSVYGLMMPPCCQPHHTHKLWNTSFSDMRAKIFPSLDSSLLWKLGM